MLLDIERVFARKIFPDVLQRAEERLFLVFQRALADAGDARIGIDFDEHKVCAEAIHHKGLYIRDFHSGISL